VADPDGGEVVLLPVPQIRLERRRRRRIKRVEQTQPTAASAKPIRDAQGRIIGVLTVAKPNRAMAPFIARSQKIVARWGFVLMGTALLVGIAAAWWLSRQLGALRRYADAVAMANRLIGGGDLSGSQIETVHRELGTALCALGRDDLARDAFKVLLGQQPDAELDGVRTSPKVLRVFEEARKELAAAEKPASERGAKKPEPRAERKAKSERNK
jgi:hypothetical protein